MNNLDDATMFERSGFDELLSLDRRYRRQFRQLAPDPQQEPDSGPTFEQGLVDAGCPGECPRGDVVDCIGPVQSCVHGAVDSSIQHTARQRRIDPPKASQRGFQE